MSSSEFWDVCGFGVTLGSLHVEAQGYVPALLENLHGVSCSGACWLLGGAWFQCRASVVAQMVRRLPGVQETQVWSLSWENPWRRKWQPTPVLLPGRFHGERSLVGYSPRGHKELDTTERLHYGGFWMSSDRSVFPGVRSSLVFSGFGFKLPGSGFQSYFYSSLKTSPSIQRQ